jgi:hypothetical protein
MINDCFFVLARRESVLPASKKKKKEGTCSIHQLGSFILVSNFAFYPNYSVGWRITNVVIHTVNEDQISLVAKRMNGLIQASHWKTRIH